MSKNFPRPTLTILQDGRRFYASILNYVRPTHPVILRAFVWWT